MQRNTRRAKQNFVARFSEIIDCGLNIIERRLPAYDQRFEIGQPGGIGPALPGNRARDIDNLVIIQHTGTLVRSVYDDFHWFPHLFTSSGFIVQQGSGRLALLARWPPQLIQKVNYPERKLQ
jgi:hypothetical protein